jgi:hypothetical protein
MRALPSYPSDGSTTASIADNVDEDDSYIARVADRCYLSTRNCWEIIRDGFVKRKRLDVTVDKGRGRRAMDEVEAEEEEIEQGAECNIVGRHSWRVLRWLVSIFEKDEEMQAESGARSSIISTRQFLLSHSC